MVGLRQLLFLCSLMGLTRSQGSTPNPVTPSQGCWYEAMCAFSNDNDIQFPIPSENTDLESRMVWCYNQCQVEQNCTDFTVHGVRGGFKCYLLTNCDEKSANDACLAQETCNSGPKDCDVAANSNCDILQTPPPDTIPWECDSDVNPYTQQVPDKTSCFLSCNAWLDNNLDQASIVSQCLGGVWQASVVHPDGISTTDISALPDPLPQPDDQNQVDCGCANYNMEWVNSATNNTVDYDPNTLPGTDFLCTGGDYMTDDGTDLKFVLKPGMTCRMFCDNYHIATMTCVNGLWTGEPELGAW